MHFPMYTVPLHAVLQMVEVEPHEELKAKGLVIEFDKNLGNAAFVSHQWLGRDNPDPQFEQFRVLQQALRHVMHNLDLVPLDAYTETIVPQAKPLHTSVLRAKLLWIWYDYFSCPQLEAALSQGKHSCSLLRAIDSIPAYVAECSFFFALCPIIESQDGSKLRTASSWSQRGWCRLERVCRELCQDSSWIMVKGPTQMELIVSSPAISGGAIGEGEFTVQDDRQKLAPVLVGALTQKLLSLLRCQDVVGYRIFLNQQKSYLRGLEVQELCELVPGLENSDYHCSVTTFFHQNGFAHVRETDRGGWSPLHYAALRGDPALLRGLLGLRANPNRTTRKDQPLLGAPACTSPLAISLFHRHLEASKVLIEARAALANGFVSTPLVAAAVANNLEGIRLLCDAGCPLQHRNLVGHTAFEQACCYNKLEALEELLAQAARAGQTLNAAAATRGLQLAMADRGGSVALVQRLVELRADVNDQSFGWWKDSVILGIFGTVKTLQYRLGRVTALSTLAYHGPGATPLILAMLTCQYEGAAALVASGARLDLRNARGMGAADFASRDLPDFLREAFDGMRGGCERVAAAAFGETFVAV